MSPEQKQLIREKWEKQYPDCTTGGVKCIDCSDKKDIENFWLNEIDLAIKQTEERIVEKIREYAEPYEDSKWLNKVDAEKIITLIRNK